MAVTVIILHEDLGAANPRADTAILAGAMLAEGKDVQLFLVAPGVLYVCSQPLVSPQIAHVLLHKLLELELVLQCCGTSLKHQGMSDHDLPRGVVRGSMKVLSAWMSEADEVVSF